MSASIRLTAGTKRRITALVARQETTAHAYMVAAIEERLAADEARLAFHAEGERRLARMKKSGKAIPADEVFSYLDALARGGKPARPKARKQT